jgi:hypothetical protein
MPSRIAPFGHGAVVLEIARRLETLRLGPTGGQHSHLPSENAALRRQRRSGKQ